MKVTMVFCKQEIFFLPFIGRGKSFLLILYLLKFNYNLIMSFLFFSYYYFLFSPTLVKFVQPSHWYSQQGQSTEWTDEKHSLYLDSLEASFVNELYHSMHLGGSCNRKSFWGTYSSRELPDKTNNSGQVRQSNFALCFFCMYFLCEWHNCLVHFPASVVAYLLASSCSLWFFKMDPGKISTTKGKKLFWKLQLTVMV